MQTILMLNSRCNAKCQHCYIPYHGERSPENAIETVKQLQSQGHQVIVAGSETLLNPEYLKAYQQAGQDYLLTNGIVLSKNPALYDKLQQHGIKQLTFSLILGIDDCVSEDLVAKVLKESKERNFKTQITTVITSLNYDTIEQMCEKAVEYKADILQFNRFVKLGAGTNITDMALTEEQVSEFFEQIVHVREIYDKSTLEIRPHGSFGPRPGSKGELLAKENNYCPAGKDLVVIDPNDNVYGCPYTMSTVIGKFENGEIKIEKDLLDGKRNVCLAHLVN